VLEHAAKLTNGDSSQQFIAFKGVEKKDLVKIDEDRSQIGKSTRISYYQLGGLMIVKLLSSLAHEAAHLLLADEIKAALHGMGLPRSSLYPCGANRFSEMASSKEGDSAFKARNARPYGSDWPNIVLEAGLSESTTQLRSDAAWWLIHSNGDVRIVILISISQQTKRLKLEKWFLAPPAIIRPVTRAHPSPDAPVPTMMQANFDEFVPCLPRNSLAGVEFWGGRK
jgi:hypothetical protein